MTHGLYEVSRSDREGRVKLPGYHAPEASAREAALSSLSLDAANVLIQGGDGQVIMQSDGKFFRLLLEPATEPLVTYTVEVVDLNTEKGEEIIYDESGLAVGSAGRKLSLRRPS